MPKSRPLFAFLASLAAALAPAADATAASRAPADPDAALAAMVEAERAFARLAIEKGMREAFIVYVAEEGVGFDNGPIPLRQSMRDRPAGPETFRLIWEPRYGDVATSGDVGYLTGPYRIESRTKAGAAVRHGCFFSVWRRQSDGGWRNILDIGVRLPEAADFPPGFTRAPHADRGAGSVAMAAVPEDAERSLRSAEKALNDAARSGTLGDALGAALEPDARVHREGVPPAAGIDAARELLAGAGRLAEAEGRFIGVSASGDLGWSYGRYAFAPAAPSTAAPSTAAPERGSYARVWTRDRKGTWRVAADIASPDREAL